MMRVAEKLGFQKEAQIRKVRYYNGKYYDSMKYGILRDEWKMSVKIKKIKDSQYIVWCDEKT